MVVAGSWSAKKAPYVLILAQFLFIAQQQLTSTSIPENTPPPSSLVAGGEHERSSVSVYRHDNTNLTRAARCTEGQREAISRQLQLADPNPKFTRLELGFFQCPRSTWLEEHLRDSRHGHDHSQDQAAAGGASHDDFLGISIGCNKGQDAIHLARLGLGSPAFDVARWIDALDMPPELWLGGCGKPAPGPGDDDATTGRARAGEVHCVEPMPRNFAALRNASRALGLAEEQGWILRQAAVSSVDGAVRFPDAGAGTEDLGLHDCDAPDAPCATVPLHSLESYVARHVRSPGPIDVLTIDVEGWDLDVLFGAGTVLDRTRYLEFEYHSVGHWASLSLPTAVELLDTKGFTCYWAGKAQLWRVTGCGFPIYHTWHGWSNLACVHRSQRRLASRMEDVFVRTLAAW